MSQMQLITKVKKDKGVYGLEKHDDDCQLSSLSFSK